MRHSLRLRYEVTLWGPAADRSGWVLRAERLVRSLHRGERVATAMLAKHPDIRTRYVGDRLAWFAQVRDRKTDEKAFLDAPEIIVPSVGELGWTP